MRLFFGLLLILGLRGLPKEWEEVLKASAIEEDMMVEQLPAVIDVLQYVFQERLGNALSQQEIENMNPEDSIVFVVI